MDGVRSFYYEFEQGTPEWFEIRSGCITGSGIKNLLTQKMGKGFYGYVNNIIEVINTGESDLQHFENVATRWGNEYEPHAARAYKYKVLQELSTPAFVKTHPLIGCSPDLITQGDNVLGEIKCYYTPNKASNLRGKIEKVYIPQCNFNAAVCGCSEFDYITFDPRNEGQKLWIERHKVDTALLSNMQYRINVAIRMINEGTNSSYPKFKFAT
tara:strand:+ start:5361 stop:5996 length:636 start_codon:yes stop_codon:yes gene_type:complete